MASSRLLVCTYTNKIAPSGPKIIDKTRHPALKGICKTSTNRSIRVLFSGPLEVVPITDTIISVDNNMHKNITDFRELQLARDYWHHDMHDNIAPLTGTWSVTVPGTMPEGEYYFYLEVRNRAFNGVDGLATNWYIETEVHISRGNTLPVVILDKD